MSLNVSADDIDTTCVTMRPVRHTIGGNGGVSRMPASCPVSVSYNNVTNTLFFYSSYVELATYYVYDEDDMLLIQGVLNITDCNAVSVSLSDYDGDFFVIQLEIDGTLYEGCLDL